MEKSPEDKRQSSPENGTNSSGTGKVAGGKSCIVAVTTSGNSRSDQICNDMKLTAVIANPGNENPYLSKNDLIKTEEPLNGMAKREEYDTILHSSTRQRTQPSAIPSYDLEPTHDSGPGLVNGFAAKRHFVHRISDNAEEIVENAMEVYPRKDGLGIATYSDMRGAIDHATELASIEEYENARKQILRQLQEANIDQGAHTGTEDEPAIKLLEQAVDINFFIPAPRSPEPASDDGEVAPSQVMSDASTDEKCSGPTESYSTTESSSIFMKPRPRRPSRYNDIIDLNSLAVDDRFGSSAVGPPIVEEVGMPHDSSTASTEDNCAILAESESANDEREVRRGNIVRRGSIKAFVYTEAEGSSDVAGEELADEEDTELRDFVDQDCQDEDDAASAFAADVEERNEESLSRLKKRFENNKPSGSGCQYTVKYASAQPSSIVLDSVSGEDSDTESKDGNIELDSMFLSNVPLPAPCQESQSVNVSRAGEHIDPVDESRPFSSNTELLIKTEKKPDFKRLGFKEL